MKYIKTFENTKPQIGDSVICTDIINRNELEEFLSTNIGTIIHDNTKAIEYPYEIRYDNIPEHLKQFFNLSTNSRNFSREEILQFTPQLNKFNI